MAARGFGKWSSTLHHCKSNHEIPRLRQHPSYKLPAHVRVKTFTWWTWRHVRPACYRISIQIARTAQASTSAQAKEERILNGHTIEAQSPVTPISSEESETKATKSKDVDAYEPSKIEAGRYDWWERNGFFKPRLTEGKTNPEGTFVIPIPPPNVTGSLHMGHALTNALQDLMIRHARMQGKSTLWVPGCDHASISTQSVVEKMLWKTQGKTRHDVGRTELLKMIWDWSSKYKSNITQQLKALGGSMDWSREAFTMDENLTEAVNATFIQLFDEGIIYRANRLVNWCSALSTSLSNLEVDNKELSGRTKLSVPGYDKKIDFGVLTYFKYRVASPGSVRSEDADRGEGSFIEVATTRPETMLGDTAIAVHPADKRYSDLIGRQVIHPFLQDRKMTIIADEEVNPEFGTGAVKITPAHDPDDFIKGQKHGLEFINILTDDGRLNEHAGPTFAGQKRFEARYTVVTALKERGLFVREESHAMTIPMCQRSKDVVEPVLRPQWWMKMAELADTADEAVRNGEITIRPESEARRFHQWMQNIQDWCLSRQLWWGHRPPAYHIQIDGMDPIVTGAERDYWVCARNMEEAAKLAEERFPGAKYTLVQDEDVLDTWFSSGLWPFAILGWPKATEDMKNFYPTSCLETGWDILFPWVARMIMLGIKLTGKVPFTDVYCHSLVRDSDGRKMSKSLGNVIDPLDLIKGTTMEALNAQLSAGNLDSAEVERAKAYQKKAFPAGISECGADALRFSLINYTTGGADIAFDIKEIEAKRRFCNKIYQATNFVLARLEDEFQPQAVASDPSSLAEQWILHKMNATADTVTKAIESRNFSISTFALYQYWLNDLCDTFIENAKSTLRPGSDLEERRSVQQTLYTALEGGLLMLHPVMPFLTEHLWQRLPRRAGDSTPSIMIARFPEYRQSWDQPEAVRDYEFILSIADSIRSIFSEFSVKSPKNILVRINSANLLTLAKDQSSIIKSLGGKHLDKISCEQAEIDAPAPKGHALRSVNANATVFLELGADFDLSSLMRKQELRLQSAKKKYQKSRDIMDKEGFSRAAPQSREKEEVKLKDAQIEVSRLEAALAELQRLRIET